MALRILIAIGVLILLNGFAASGIVGRWPAAASHPVACCLLTVAVILLQLVGPFGDRLFFPRLKKNWSGLVKALDGVSYLAFGIMSSLFIYNAVADAIEIVWKLAAPPVDPMAFDRRILTALIAVTTGLTLIGFVQRLAGPFVRRVEIALKDLPAAFDGFRIVQISDLHVGPTIGRRYVEKVVRMANGLKPDLIALTGDFADGHVAELRDIIAPLGGLSAPQGKFFITGNHEYYWDAPGWMAEQARLGARVLDNRHEIVRKDGAEIVIAGVTDHSTVHISGNQASDPQKAIAGAPPGLVKILLAHQPVSYTAAAAAGFALQLSGHTHGGQFFPFSLLIGFFQRFYKGLNRYHDLQIYVSVGTGYWGPPLRTFVPAEITLITLRPWRA